MTKKSRNKLYTLSYFKKRLRQAGWKVGVLIPSYSDHDKRYWTICIGEDVIFCTCLKYIDEEGDLVTYFHFSDNNQKLMIDKTISTQSMKVILEFLDKTINT